MEENGLAILSGLLSASRFPSVLVAALETLAEFAATSSSPSSPSATAAAAAASAARDPLVADQTGLGAGPSLEGLTSASGTNAGLITRCGKLCSLAYILICPVLPLLVRASGVCYCNGQ